MFDKPINEITLKELQEIEYQEYDGTPITDIIVVPLNKRGDSKYRRIKYILRNTIREHICGVLGKESEIMQFNKHSGLNMIRIDCLYRSKCLRFMLAPAIILSDLSTLELSEFYIEEKE